VKGKAKPNTVRLTNDEVLLINAMRDVSESFFSCLCYSDPIFSLQVGLQGSEIIEHVKKSNSDGYKYLMVALNKERESEVLKNFSKLSRNVIAFGFETPTFNKPPIIYRQYLYAIDIQNTIQEFYVYLKDHYSSFEKEFIEEKSKMKQREYIHISLNKDDAFYFKKILDIMIDITEDTLDPSICSEEMYVDDQLNIQYLKLIREKIDLRKRIININFHVLFADLIISIFEITEMFWEEQGEKGYLSLSKLEEEMRKHVEEENDVVQYYKRRHYREGEQGFKKEILESTSNF
jgi:hypothetical protein